MLISLIVAVAENNVIGGNNQLLWRLSDDLKNFKRITTGHTILMGRKTFESIGKALPKRENIVITRKENFSFENIKTFNSIKTALEYCKNQGREEVFMIGGGEIYRETFVLADKIYYTQVKTTLDGDTFFPKIDWQTWDVLTKESFYKNEKNEYDFDFLVLERKK